MIKKIAIQGCIGMGEEIKYWLIEHGAHDASIIHHLQFEDEKRIFFVKGKYCYGWDWISNKQNYDLINIGE